MEFPPRTPACGPTFIRLLAGLADADASPPRQSLSERLSQWIDWKQAVTLSGALDGPPACVDAQHTNDLAAAAGTDCARVRAALTQAITGDRAFADGGDAVPDAAFFRQRHLALQQAMEAGIGQLRGRLRDRLYACSPALARLAAVDAAMERALVRREHALMSAVPALASAHYERLRAAACEPADAWLDTFRRDLRQVLLAELDLRLQPAEGLLAALRNRPMESRDPKSA